MIEGLLLRAAATGGIPPVESRHWWGLGDDSPETDRLMKR